MLKLKTIVQCGICFLAITPTLWAQTEAPQLPVDNLPAELSLTDIPAGLASERPVPDDNALTTARAQLGRRLFFASRLSRDGSTSCASCHVPEKGFASSDRVPVGVDGKMGTRNSPTVLNRAYGTAMFWDGRARTLEEQALQPIENPLEMDTQVETVVERLSNDAEYRRQFAEAYEGGVNADNLAKALASFQRVLLSGNSAVDRFHGGEFAALSRQQRQGLWIFESRGGCWKCHMGRNFTDEGFHNTGVSWGQLPLDLGRFAVTSRDEDRGRFHTPTLRNVARTGPYMHDGSIATLEEVVAFYNRGGNANPYLDGQLKPLQLSEKEQAALVAFLQALTGAEQEALPAVDARAATDKK